LTSLIPPALKPGDLVGIISPASPPRGEKVQYYEKGKEYLRQKGYRIVEGEYVLQEYGYLAGPDEHRLHDLNNMLANPEVKAIIFSRGGYGTARLLRDVDYQAIIRNPKVIVGYSDITSLQLAIYAKTGLITFSGPMVAVEMGKGMDPVTEEYFWPMLCKPGLHRLDIKAFGQNARVYRPGIAEGRLIGGCFSLIAPLIGTEYLPDFENAILVLEDIDEDLYRLDRYFAHMRNAGLLEKLRGIIFGQFIDCEKTDDSSPMLSLEQIIHDYTHQLNIPIMGNFPYGHGARKFTLPIGANVRLDTNQGTIELLESVIKNDIS